MPLVQVKLIENVFTPEQKSQIIRKLIDAIVSIQGDNMCPVTSVVIEEYAAAREALAGRR
jgi:4-oxalocrotonate tautomerase